MSLAELSAATGYAKSTIHGLLYTMRLKEIISQSEVNGKYWLGKKLTELGELADMQRGEEQ